MEHDTLLFYVTFSMLYYAFTQNYISYAMLCVSRSFTQNYILTYTKRLSLHYSEFDIIKKAFYCFHSKQIIIIVNGI